MYYILVSKEVHYLLKKVPPQLTATHTVQSHMTVWVALTTFMIHLRVCFVVAHLSFIVIAWKRAAGTVTISLFVIRNKVIQIWNNNMRLSKWGQNIHFWINYSFDDNASMKYILFLRFYFQLRSSRASFQTYIVLMNSLLILLILFNQTFAWQLLVKQTSCARGHLTAIVEDIN